MYKEMPTTLMVDNLPEAFDCLQLIASSTMKDVKACSQSKDYREITFRDNCQCVYIELWRVLVITKEEKWIDALPTAEKGPAQALMDLITSQYGLEGTLPKYTTKACLIFSLRRCF